MVKRAIDLTVAVVGLVIVTPVLLLVSAAILVEDGPPVLFAQERIGRGGRPFTLVKLRSMRVHSFTVEQIGWVGSRHPLFTKVGGLARRLKIDELPQLWNVVRGEMSLVGPRPTMPEQFVRYGPFERRRCEVLPGLSGWAQVNGGVLLEWPDRIRMDVWYIDHWSPWLDIKVLMLTLVVLVRGERVNRAAVDAALRTAREPSRPAKADHTG